MSKETFGNYRVPVLKSFSPEQIENVIAKGLSELAGEDVNVTINRIATASGNSGTLFGTIEMDLRISRAQSFLDEIRTKAAKA